MVAASRKARPDRTDRHLQHREPDAPLRLSGYRNELRQDRALKLFEIRDEKHYRDLEQARAVAQTDDTRQLSALAIAEADADIICLQEVDNLEALKAFEYGYLFKMMGAGYRHKALVTGNDTRGIDVAVMLRDETRYGEAIEVVSIQSNAHLTFGDLGLHTPDLEKTGNMTHDRVFRRDCLEVDLTIGGRPLTLFVTHFKSMGAARDGIDGRTWTMPIRLAEARAVRHVVIEKFGPGARKRNWLICGDLNDYRERIDIGGDRRSGYTFTPRREAQTTSVDVLTADDFCVNLVERRPELDRWTLYHTRGPQERHLCQLDYIFASPALAGANPTAIPEIVRGGQPWRTIFPPGQEVERYPRAGWDRPKASDHSPVVVELALT